MCVPYVPSLDKTRSQTPNPTLTRSRYILDEHTTRYCHLSTRHNIMIYPRARACTHKLYSAPAPLTSSPSGPGRGTEGWSGARGGGRGVQRSGGRNGERTGRGPSATGALCGPWRRERAPLARRLQAVGDDALRGRGDVVADERVVAARVEERVLRAVVVSERRAEKRNGRRSRTSASSTPLWRL